MKTNLRVYWLTTVMVALLLGWGASMVVAQGDPGAPGPRAVTRAEYDFGDAAFEPSESPGPIEIRASVHSPTDLTGGPFPLIILLHGRHATCFQGADAFLEWPCTPPRQPILSFRGYDYWAEILASHGFIVVSISANGINAVDNGIEDLGMLVRAQLIQEHLNIWNTFNTTGGTPFGDRFVGKVNLNNVGTMGHSRGGEGVVRHFVFNAALGSPFRITAVLPLAPVDFNRPVINNVPLAVPLPYCDGDVADLQGVHFYDDARYNLPGDTAAKHVILVQGANHNFYNTQWTPPPVGDGPPGAADDWLEFVPGGPADPHCGSVAGNQRLTPAQQRGTLVAFGSAFFRTYVGGERDFFPILQGDAPPPPSALTDQILVSYHPADNPTRRRDVNRLLDNTNLTSNTLGGVVTQTGLTPYDLCGGEEPQPEQCLPTQPTFRQPHTTPSARAVKRGLSQLRMGWNDLSATLQNELPPGSRNVSGFVALQFRAGVNFDDVRNPVGMPQDFTVTLTDGAARSATARVGAFSRALLFPPGQVLAVPKLFLNTVRIPLGAFTGVDLTNIVSVTFSYDQRATGALMITDLAFADAP